jgi:bisphosphoglycerate-independent phosphoglycerate mutase (AlkP superfamily)
LFNESLLTRLLPVVIDGWGVPGEQSPKDGDAITNAKSPTMDGFAQVQDGYMQLEASSTAVGLPEGLMGNSEVGHLNIGAGRVVYQDVVRIGESKSLQMFLIHDTCNVDHTIFCSISHDQCSEAHEPRPYNRHQSLTLCR